MHYDREADRLSMSVTELARYAYQRENPRALTERYGFRRLTEEADGIPEPEPASDLSDPEIEGFSSVRRGETLHHVMETDVRYITDCFYDRTESRNWWQTSLARSPARV